MAIVSSGLIPRFARDAEVRILPPQPASQSLTHTESGRARNAVILLGGRCAPISRKIGLVAGGAAIISRYRRKRRRERSRKRASCGGRASIGITTLAANLQRRSRREIRTLTFRSYYIRDLYKSPRLHDVGEQESSCLYVVTSKSLPHTCVGGGRC